MKEINEEISAVIEKNLPAQVGETLKKVLEQGKKNAETVKQQAEQIDKLAKSVLNKESIIAEYKAFDDRNSKLNLREQEILEKERNLEIETLKYQLKCEVEKTTFSKDVALGLVRNTEYRRILSDTKCGPDGKDQFGNSFYSTHSQNSTENIAAK